MNFLLLYNLIIKNKIIISKNMNNFWNNIYKFPRFLISVFIGFFLITLKPIFKLLKEEKNQISALIIINITIYSLYIIIKKMLDIE